MEDQERLRAKAAHYRKLAGQMTDQRVIDVLEELAGEYEQAAQGQCDERATRADGGECGPGSQGGHKG